MGCIGNTSLYYLTTSSSLRFNTCKYLIELFGFFSRDSCYYDTIGYFVVQTSKFSQPEL